VPSIIVQRGLVQHENERGALPEMLYAARLGQMVIQQLDSWWQRLRAWWADRRQVRMSAAWRRDWQRREET
jgi:hypothetical protein